eukprot:jgi/Galph1/4713/GphlegSOOS_G3388.1
MTNTKNISCSKCQKERATVYDVGGSKCDCCFTQTLLRKVKTTLSRKGLAQFGDKVGLAVSGGYSSQALVDLIGRILSEREDGKATRMKLNIIIFHVALDIPGTGQNNDENWTVIKELAANYSFPVFSTIENASELQILVQQACKNIPWKDLKDRSDVLDISRILIYRIVTYMAYKFGCKQVFDGRNASSICMEIVKSLSSGNGMALPFIASAKDYSGMFRDISVHHPLYDIPERFLIRYVWMRNINFVSPNLIQGASFMSVDDLTTHFLKELEEQHRSTLPNILRTASKCVLPCDYSYCCFCRIPMFLFKIRMIPASLQMF